MTGVLFWDVSLNVCKKWVTFIHLWLVSWQGDPIRFHEEERQLPFHASAIQVLHTFCYFMAVGMRIFIVQKPPQMYIVSNWCPPFNLTAAAEVLIVITCDVSMNMCMCDECTCACPRVYWYVSLVSMKRMWRLQTSPYPLGRIGLAALNAQSLRSISEKAQHSGSWSDDQMYFCNFFVKWDCWILWTDPSSFRNRCSPSAFPLLLSLPPAVELQWHIHKSGHCRFHVKNGHFFSH